MHHRYHLRMFHCHRHVEVRNALVLCFRVYRKGSPIHVKLALEFCDKRPSYTRASVGGWQKASSMTERYNMVYMRRLNSERGRQTEWPELEMRSTTLEELLMQRA